MFSCNTKVKFTSWIYEQRVIRSTRRIYTFFPLPPPSMHFHISFRLVELFSPLTLKTVKCSIIWVSFESFDAKYLAVVYKPSNIMMPTLSNWNGRKWWQVTIKVLMKKQQIHWWKCCGCLGRVLGLFRSLPEIFMNIKKYGITWWAHLVFWNMGEKPYECEFLPVTKYTSARFQWPPFEWCEFVATGWIGRAIR